MRFTFLLLFVGATCHYLSSQTSENHYVLRLHTVSTENIKPIESFLTKITGATAISFQPKDSSFLLLTPRVLDKQVIAGKMLKNYYPVKSILHLETDTDPFPVMHNSSDPEADAIRYEQEKQAWVKKYPEAYKRMLEKK